MAIYLPIGEKLKKVDGSELADDGFIQNDFR